MTAAPFFHALSSANGSTGRSSATSATSATKRDPGQDTTSFDRHLQNDRVTKDATSAAARRRADSTAAGSGRSEPPRAQERTAARQRSDHTTESSPVQPPGETGPAPETATDAPAQDAWPPLGLAGLALSPVSVPGVVPPALVADPAGQAPTAATPGPASALTAQAPPSPALPAAAAANTKGVEANDVPPDAFEVLPEALAVEAALEGASEGSGEAPDPLASLLQPGALLPATRSLAEAAALRGTGPTATPVMGQEGFDDAVSARIGWLADQKIGHAHIRISPDDMGTIDVRLQMDGDRIHATFASPHVEVRQALEGSLPRLRELLGEQGFQLAQADVGHHGGDGRSEARGGERQGAGGRQDGESARVETTVTAAQLIRQRGLLDTYA